MTRDRRSDVRLAVERDARRLARRERGNGAFWRSLSLLGTVGWSLVLPVAGGALLGWFLDRHLVGGARLTVLLVFAGAGVGAVLAWHAIRRAHGGA